MIIDPNPLLIEYYQKASELNTDYDISEEFYDNEEWHYIQSNLEKNILILKRLEEKNLLKNENKIIDCGVGLGTALYDLYLQSKELKQKKFQFTGIEKWKPYLNYLQNNLLYNWNGDLNLINSDIMNFNYSEYNIIYTYTPFKDTSKLIKFYRKVVNEIHPGSLIIENKNNGFGLNDALLEIEELSPIILDDRVIFLKR